MTRIATCRCGQLRAECEGEPFRVSVCHCLPCRQRSGSVFATQARFRAEQVTITGSARTWVRIAESGAAATFHFCPECGSDVWYINAPRPDELAIPVGAFADPDFPAPQFSVFENRKSAWVEIVGDGIEHD